MTPTISKSVEKGLQELHETIKNGLLKKGMEYEQRTALKKLIAISNQIDLPLMNWLKAYFAEYPLPELPMLNEAFLSERKIEAIQKMKEAMLNAESKRYSTIFHVSMANQLLNGSFRGKIPILEWIGQYISQETKEGILFRCPNAHCNFTTYSHSAYVGHGPSRCLRKYQKSLLSDEKR